MGLRRPLPSQIARPRRALQRTIGRALIGRRYSLADGSERVYFFHMRKTGGTSVNNAVLASLGGEEPNDVKLRLRGPVQMTRTGGFVVAAHNAAVLERGRYIFGWSHHPAWSLQLPPRTFTLTVVRDPVARVVSLYRYLADPEADRGQVFPAPEQQRRMAADGFDAFLDRVPTEMLLGQLHMFSRHHAPREAAERLAACSLVVSLEDMEPALRTLSDLFGRPVLPRHDRRSVTSFAPSQAQLRRLEEALQPEYEMLRLASGATGRS